MVVVVAALPLMVVVVEGVEVLPCPQEVGVGEEGEALGQPLCPLCNKEVNKIWNSKKRLEHLRYIV